MAAIPLPAALESGILHPSIPLSICLSILLIWPCQHQSAGTEDTEGASQECHPPTRGGTAIWRE